MSNKWGTTIKLTDKLAESIDKHVENKTLNYRSRNDFVIKSTEKELEHGTIMQGLNDTGKIFYEDLLREKRIAAYKESRELTENPLYIKNSDKRLTKIRKSIKNIEMNKKR